MEIADTLEYLLGTWSVRRAIADYRAGVRGSFHGTATVRLLEEGEREPSGAPSLGHPAGAAGAAVAGYEETGSLRLGEHEGAATRQLRFTQGPDGTVMVDFRDGRRFIACDLRTGTWRAAHPCDADRYELRFLVRSQEVLEEHWRVRGPSKDYEAWTTLRRVGAEGPGPV